VHELIFHEASHVESLESPLATLVEEVFRAAGGEAPERFWHDMIFFTTGTITRIALDELGQFRGCARAARGGGGGG
jgi:hypothetical protein